VSDHYKLFAQEEEEKFEEKLVESYDSEDTNDEIYSAHEGVDFRPTNDEQLSFAV
jgi:hypothetical protein